MRALCVGLFVFLLFVGLGIRHASDKPLWNDEIHSWVTSIEGSTVLETLQKPFWTPTREGNSSPAYYLIQRAFLRVLNIWPPEGYSISSDGALDTWTLTGLRLSSIICLSAAIALLTATFFAQFGWGAALLTLGSSFGTYMVWTYIAEARPYALWFLLTTLQWLALRVEKPKPWAVFAVHMGLALTVTLSIPQILFAAALTAWTRSLSRQHILWTCGVPALIAIAYAIASPHYAYHFVWSPWRLLFAAVAPERIALLGVFWAFVLKTNRSAVPHLRDLLTTTGTLLCGLAWIAVFWIMQSDAEGGFEIPNRYWVFVAPASIAWTTFASVKLWSALQSKRNLQLLFGLAIASVTVLRILRVAPFWI